MEVRNTLKRKKKENKKFPYKKTRRKKIYGKKEKEM